MKCHDPSLKFYCFLKVFSSQLIFFDRYNLKEIRSEHAWCFVGELRVLLTSTPVPPLSEAACAEFNANENSHCLS